MTQTYSTQMEAAKLGIVTPQMAQVAEDEGIDAEVIRERAAPLPFPPTTTTLRCTRMALAKGCVRKST